MNDVPPTLLMQAKPAAVIVQQGKVLDFIDGTTQRNETPEEYVRQARVASDGQFVKRVLI